MSPLRASALLLCALGLALGSGAGDAAARGKPKSTASQKAARTKDSKRKRKGEDAKPEAAKPAEPPARRFRGVCRLQRAKSFLKRERFVVKGQLRGDRHQKALKWRIERYGHVDGVPFEKLNPAGAFKHAKQVRFMGLPITVHEKIAPALSCVESRIRKTCNGKGRRYQAKAIGGFRQANTYRGGEVSNHLFGIAVDIDPDKNPCCGCVDPWPSHPSCKKETSKVIEKAGLTQCWVDAFERYGFYWLGRDELEDTMHFEFLGDPDRIVP
ncbi:MAG: M15 family metallopeptidase [Polyangiaceae bacterium]